MYNTSKTMGAIPGMDVTFGKKTEPTTPAGPCPDCDCKDVEVIEQMFISELPSADAMQFNLIEETKECTDLTGGKTGKRQVDCATIKAALNQKYGGTVAGFSCGPNNGYNGFGNAAEEADPIPLPADNGIKPTQKAGFNYGVLGFVILAGLTAGTLYSKYN